MITPHIHILHTHVHVHHAEINVGHVLFLVHERRSLKWLVYAKAQRSR